MAAPFRQRFPLSVSSAQDPGFPDPRAEADRIARVLRAQPSWCPDQALPRSHSGPTSPPLPSSVGSAAPATPEPAAGRTPTADRGMPAPAPSWRSAIPPSRSFRSGAPLPCPASSPTCDSSLSTAIAILRSSPEHLRGELHDPLLPHGCPPAERPRARGLKSMGCAAQ
jgi:hypothetical protein